MESTLKRKRSKQYEIGRCLKLRQSFGVQSFLGLAGYYRKFVRKFAHRVHLLHDLVAKLRTEFKWTKQHRDQFEDLK
jgi:hypothetical protein